MKARRVTIEDVAAEAGVSIATVSRVMHNKDGVAPETFSRVQETIDRLGYESSLVARSLRSRRTNVLGFSVNEIEPYSAELLKGAARAIHGSGYELIVYAGGRTVPETAGWERKHLSRLGGTLTDGTVLVTPRVLDVETVTPVVAVDPHVGASALPTVASDSLTGAITATEYLMSLGHRRIGHLSGRPDLRSSELREEGYRQALENAGIPFDPDLVRVGGYSPETAVEPARELLTLPDRPTAVFAANDVSALQTIAVARQLGIDVPAELSVIGFDNIPESVFSDPALTTIDHAIQDQGHEAAQMLMRIIEDPSSGHTDVRLPTRLVIRQSCQPVAASGGGD
ncbi:MAG TPA: LacI family DNA-binding transcriptional regulator [Acidimicrobiia bacterium]|nr:LacI family DNA-binding transcriptional regulator [Acidimicrobiia bacterium]